jgi:transcriptional regulator with XRE-family HTH domain
MTDSDPKPPRLGPLRKSGGLAYARPEPAGTPSEALIGQRIKALRKELGLTQTQFATAVETTQSAVSKWERRDEMPSDVFVEKIAVLTGTTAGYIRYGDAYQRRRVPIIGSVGAGGAILADAVLTESIDSLLVPSLVPYDAVGLIVRGDVLFPEVDDATVLIYRRDAPFEEAPCLGKRCIVELTDGRFLVKRIVRGSALARYTLLSTNVPALTDVEIAWAAPILAYIAL